MAPRGAGGASCQLNPLLFFVALVALTLTTCRGLRLQEERLQYEEEADAGDVCIWKKANSNHSWDQASTRYKDIFDVQTDLHAEEADVELEHEQRQSQDMSLLDTGRGQRIPCHLPKGEKYLMVLNAFEQFGGARQVLGDAVNLAKALNRTIVEPVTRNGRVVNPFFERHYVPLGEMLDLDAMKKYWPNWISIGDFMANCEKPVAEKSMPPMQVVMKKEAMDDHLVKELRLSRNKILALSHFMRKGNSSFTDRTVDGVPLEPSKWISNTAKSIMRMLDPRVESNGYICAHWRSEGVVKKEQHLSDCADAFADQVHKVMKCKLWNGYWPKVFLLSDLRNDTSDTAHGQAMRSKYAVELDKKIHHHQVGWALEAIKDNGQRALVEQYICARARIMVGCPADRVGAKCGSCARLQSKFAAQIMDMRDELGMPRVLNW